jgi:hypothetical protein
MALRGLLKDFATLHHSVHSMDVLLRGGFRTTFSGSGRERLPVQFRTESENTDWNVAPCSSAAIARRPQKF